MHYIIYSRVYIYNYIFRSCGRQGKRVYMIIFFFFQQLVITRFNCTFYLSTKYIVIKNNTARTHMQLFSDMCTYEEIAIWISMIRWELIRRYYIYIRDTNRIPHTILLLVATITISYYHNYTQFVVECSRKEIQYNIDRVARAHVNGNERFYTQSHIHTNNTI